MARYGTPQAGAACWCRISGRRACGCQASSAAGGPGKTSAQRRRGMNRVSAANQARSPGSYRIRPAFRRSTAFSCRSTSSSALFARSPRTTRTARLNNQRISRQAIFSSTWPANQHRTSLGDETAGQARDRVSGRHRVGDHGQVRGVDLRDVGSGPVGREELLGRGDDAVVHADDVPGRDRLPGRDAGRIGERVGGEGPLGGGQHRAFAGGQPVGEAAGEHAPLDVGGGAGRRSGGFHEVEDGGLLRRRQVEARPRRGQVLQVLALGWQVGLPSSRFREVLDLAIETLQSTPFGDPADRATVIGPLVTAPSESASGT
jgi:hypothetical protein